jgi:hypothetical protein
VPATVSTARSKISSIAGNLNRRGAGPNLSFLTYPLTTGPAADHATIHYQVLPHTGNAGFTQEVLWISPSGDALIGGWTTIASGPLKAAANDVHLGVMSHGKFTPPRFPPGFAQQVSLGATTIAS